MYTDESGEGFFTTIIIGAVVGAIVGATFGGIQAAISGDNIWLGVMIGAVAGGVGEAVGGFTNGLFLSPLFARVTASLIYDISYPLIQHGGFSKSDGLVLLTDLAIDFALMGMYSWIVNEGISSRVLSSAIVGLIDETIDTLQTKLIYCYMVDDFNEKFTVKASSKYYIVGM